MTATIWIGSSLFYFIQNISYEKCFQNDLWFIRAFFWPRLIISPPWQTAYGRIRRSAGRHYALCNKSLSLVRSTWHHTGNTMQCMAENYFHMTIPKPTLKSFWKIIRPSPLLTLFVHQLSHCTYSARGNFSIVITHHHIIIISSLFPDMCSLVIVNNIEEFERQLWGKFV